MLYQAQPPVTKYEYNDKWKLENTTEASVLGRQFAQAVIMVATGSSEEVLHKKKEYPPCKKIFWEEPRYNAALENPNGNYAFDAHMIEETKHWKKAGKKFVGGLRFPAPRNHNGPLLPGEFPHIFEKPVIVFSRSGELRPFTRARKFNKPMDRSVSNPEKVTTVYDTFC